MAEKKVQSYLREVASANGDASAASLPVPPSFETEYPAISEYMSKLAFLSGTPRQVSTITLLLEDGKLKACLNDRAQQRGLWRSGDSLEEVLACLECALADPRSTWRKWQPQFEQRVSRK